MEIIGKQIKDLPVWARALWPGGTPVYFTAPSIRLTSPQHMQTMAEIGIDNASLIAEQMPLLTRAGAHDLKIEDTYCIALQRPENSPGDRELVLLTGTGGMKVLSIETPWRKYPGGIDLEHPKLKKLLERLPHAYCRDEGPPEWVDIFVPDNLRPGVYDVGGLEVEVGNEYRFFPYYQSEVVDRPLTSIYDVTPVFRRGDLPSPEQRRARGHAKADPARRPTTRHHADVIDVPVKVKDPIKLSFASAGDFLDKSYMQWRVQDFLPATGVAMIYGASQSGKTLLGIDLAGAVLNGRDWLGQPTEKAPVAYAALEGPEGFRDRVKAYAKHHGKNSLADLKVLDKTFSLTDRDHLDVLIKQLRAIGYREGIFIIDTLSVVAHGDLNQNSFGSEVYRACKRIVDAVGGLVLLVHHTGKDEDKGAKGASSITQHIDTILKVEDRRGMRAVKIEKQRDGDTSQKLRFAVKPVAIGQDDRGKTVTSVIAVEDHYGKVVLRGHNQDALDILDDLVETVGRTPDELQLRDKVGLSEGTRLITKDEWKNAFLNAVRTTTDKQKEARRRAYDRAYSALGDLGFYGFHGDFIYLKK